MYEAIGDYLAALLDVDVTLTSDASRSGPGPGTANPFARGEADVGFVCAPSYVWLADQHPASIAPARVAPVPHDPRNGGRAEYYAELVVSERSDLHSFADLEGCRFGFNDESSLSGFHSVRDRLASAGRDFDLFESVVQSGSHLRSLELLSDGAIDVAAIDANTLIFMRAYGAELGLRVVESLGPYPVQPVVLRASMGAEVRQRIVEGLLDMHFASGGEPLRRFGVQRFVEVDDIHYEAIRGRLAELRAGVRADDQRDV